MLVTSPLSPCYCGSLLSYEVVLIMFHLGSPLRVFVCACSYWYSSLFHFPLEKLASFDGPGKTTKREALTLTHFLFSLFFIPPPTRCFYFAVLNSSHSIFPWIAITLPFSAVSKVPCLVCFYTLFKISWIAQYSFHTEWVPSISKCAK